MYIVIGIIVGLLVILQLLQTERFAVEISDDCPRVVSRNGSIIVTPTIIHSATRLQEKKEITFESPRDYMTWLSDLYAMGAKCKAPAQVTF